MAALYNIANQYLQLEEQLAAALKAGEEITGARLVQGVRLNIA